MAVLEQIYKIEEIGKEKSAERSADFFQTEDKVRGTDRLGLIFFCWLKSAEKPYIYWLFGTFCGIMEVSNPRG
ncbi:MAG: hypothetical protein IJL03_06725, partial [Lachnospiraceae bacterium]|nr:hypothetical protein [Lachnospiraceae bacterium]